MNLSTNRETLFWQKKEFISFVLSVLVFFIHISTFSQYASSGNFISIINAKFSYFFKESITRFAVPMFFILSGITFFKDYDNKKYFGKIKSRIHTLIIPYLIWNVIWMIFEIICSYTFVSKYFIGREPFTLSFINILKGIFFYKFNLPFWFIFDIIIFSFAAPLIYVIIKNKYVGLFAVILLSVLSIFGIQIPSSVFFSPTSIIFYMIGAIIGKHFFDFTFRKTTKITQYSSVIFLTIYIVLKNIFRIQTNSFTLFLSVIIFTLSSFAVWSITDIFFDKIKPRAIYSRSFAVYAIHLNISSVITKLIFLILPKSEWFAIPNFIITTILSFILINFVCYLLDKFCPKIYSILMGSRSRPNLTSKT